jgi:hypothetical protein
MKRLKFGKVVGGIALITLWVSFSSLGAAKAEESADGLPTSPSIVFVDRDLAAANKTIAELRAAIEAQRKFSYASLSQMAGDAGSAKEFARKARSEIEALMSKLSVSEEALKTSGEEAQKDRLLSLEALTIAKADFAKAQEEKSKLMVENQRLLKLVEIKNTALDNAIKTLASKAKTGTSVLQSDSKTGIPAGEMFNEELLGPIAVLRVSDEQMIVTVPANIDKMADTRFLGAVIEKRKVADKVVYTLDASKLAKKTAMN